MGYMVYFQVVRSVLRYEAHTRDIKSVNRKDIVQITLPKNTTLIEISKSKKREIRVGQAMYDIVDEIAGIDSVTYTCIRDHKEESLLAKTRNLNNPASPENTKHKPVRIITESIIKIALVTSYTRMQETSYRNDFPAMVFIMASMPYPDVEEHPPQTAS